MFHVGQQVVCVRTPWMVLHEQPPWLFPTLSSTYIVREIVPWPNGAGISFRLAEIRNEPVNGFEPAFSSEFFRPAVERKTDISIFTELLTPKVTESA